MIDTHDTARLDTTGEFRQAPPHTLEHDALKSLMQTRIDWDALPEKMRTLQMVLGSDALFRLSRTYGGASIYVPQKSKEAHPLQQLLGCEAMDSLIAAYGGERLDVPKLDPLFRQLRKQDIKQAREEGCDIASLASRHNLSRRRVLQILAD